MPPKLGFTNATSWDPFKKKLFVYPISTQNELHCTCSPCFPHPLSQQMDGWQNLSRAGCVLPLSIAVVARSGWAASVWDLFKVFCHKMILMTHGSYLCYLRWQTCLCVCFWFPAYKRKKQVCLPCSFFSDHYGVRRCRKGAEEKESWESLLIVLWARIFSKNSNLHLLITCCRAVRPQGSLDIRKWPECTE